MKTRDLELYKQLHVQDSHYGSTPAGHFDRISNFITTQNPKSILDFGCGKGTMGNLLKKSYPNMLVHSYDPAIKEYESIPNSRYDMVITTDVLEHLYEDEIAGIFEEILKLDPSSMYHVICHRLAYAKLPDGSNAHKTVQSPEWWADRLKQILGDRFAVTYTNQGVEAGYFEIVKQLD